MNDPSYDKLCRSATNAAGILQGKWRIPILCALQGGPVRLGQLVRLMPTASKKVMAENLRQLQEDGVLVRTDFSESLLHVEYDYAEIFRSGMTAVLASLSDVGELRANKAPKTKE
jgi:DNA-binding HxlR family transcriptional regulator